MTALVLLDNTVLSNFALAGRPDLLQLLWPSDAYVTENVLVEYTKGAQSGQLPTDAWDHLPCLTLTPEEEAMSAAWPPSLGPGERSILAIAVMRGGIFASDDQYARRVARENHVEVTGTIGILVASVRNGYLDLSAANELLAHMIKAGYRSPLSALDMII